MKIAFLLYPTANVNVQEDTSFWLMHELARRGHAVFHFESRGLFWKDGTVRAALTRSRLDPRRGFMNPRTDRLLTDLATFDCVFIRKEPPFDNEYLHALQLLELIKQKVFVLNDPLGIAVSGEKLLTLSFRDWIPETLVTSDIAEARRFARRLARAVVVKPLNEKGGSGILRTSSKDPNFPSILEISTQHGTRKILVQRFLEANRSTGDKRILILDGRILGSFLRRPSRADFRANLGVGGSMHRSLPDAREKRLVEAIAPELARRGLFFVGIDVIGGYLSEVNVTSPSGVPEIHALYRQRPEKEVADFIERRF